VSRAKQIIELSQVLLAPTGRRAARTWKPFSLTAFKMLRALAADGIRPRTIVDGGANIGQFARAAVETFPGARLIAFEPLEDLVAELRANLLDCARVTVHATALGRRDGTVAIHRNAYSPASSILSLRSAARESFPEVVEAEVVEVPIGRLDTLLENEPLEPPALLKLDLQGFELEALHGAGELLHRFDYALVETSFTSIYESEPLFGDVHAFMAAAGFGLRRPAAVLEDARGVIAQMDALFARSD
jgi:FkbM family methyltransferase